MKEKVYAYLKTIPKGKVTTYGRIAQHLGNRHYAQTVGNILHDNPDPSQYPCHRVLDRDGRVAEHYAFGGAAAQRKRLEDEGIVFKENGTVDLTKYGMEECLPKTKDSKGSGNAIDSYQEFLNYFNLSKDDLYHWGISATVFPSQERVKTAWEDLKERIFNNKTVYIRGYGRDAHGTELYQNLYKYLFGNENIKKDPINNAIPHKRIQTLTGMKRNRDVLNYQVSHIWGHTKNVFMFEAPWNICYTPKLIDPFTGHETQGVWPDEYQKLFVSHAYRLYKPFIDEYNQILLNYDVMHRFDEYLQVLEKQIPHREFLQFKKDAVNELSPIVFDE